MMQLPGDDISQPADGFMDELQQIAGIDFAVLFTTTYIFSPKFISP
jgi:hypothetical protein